MLPDQSFQGEQDEVGIDVSFVDFVEDDEGVLFEEVSAVDQSLQEDAVGHEDDSIFASNVGSHADLVADHVLLRHLLLHYAVQVKHGQPPRLHAHHLSVGVRRAQVLVNEPGDLS